MRPTWMIVAIAAGCGARSELYVPAVFTCPLGWDDCNGDPADACETDTRSSVSNCGACGHTCAAGLYCGAGKCHDGEDVVAIALGDDFGCALKAKGEVRCWGRNAEGQLGRGVWSDFETVAAPVVGLD